MTLENVGEAFDFVKPNINSRGIKQCIFEFMHYDYFKKSKSDNIFLIAKNEEDKITATAATCIANNQGNKSPLLCCFKVNNELGHKAQELLVDTLSKFTKDKKRNLYVPTWCNDMDDVSLKMYKKRGLDIKV